MLFAAFFGKIEVFIISTTAFRLVEQTGLFELIQDVEIVAFRLNSRCLQYSLLSGVLVRYISMRERSSMDCW